jgi:hypothetical protein
LLRHPTHRLSALVEQDLDEIWSYVAEDASPTTADEWRQLGWLRPPTWVGREVEI